MIQGKLTNILKETVIVDKEIKRNYIGASSIGDLCLRKSWFDFHDPNGSTNLTVEKSSIFSLGKKIEQLILDLLEKSNINIIRPDQFNHYLEFFDSELPYFRGHCDALLFNPRSIIEIKSAKSSEFAKFIRLGLQKWHQKYYAQIQAYMGMSGIHEAYFIIMNKDNCQIMDEYIVFDPDFYKILKTKARSIYNAKHKPPKISNSPIWYHCKMCPHNKKCHEI